MEHEHGSLADVHVVAHADLAGHHHVVAGRRAAGDADLRANEVVPAEPAVVGDHHQVVDLRALADDGRAVGAAVDRRAGADLDVLADLDVAELGRELVPAVDLAIAEAVGADHGAGVNDGAVADARVFVQHDVGKERHAGADDAAGHDVHAGVNRRAGADVAVVADGGAGVDVDVVGESWPMGLTMACGLTPMRTSCRGGRKCETAAANAAWTSFTTIAGLPLHSTSGEAITAAAGDAASSRSRSGWSASVISPARARPSVAAPVSSIDASPHSAPPTSRASSPRVVGIARRSFPVRRAIEMSAASADGPSTRGG